MMKILRGLSIFFLILGAVYLVGPRVEKPVFNELQTEVPTDLLSLDNWVNTREKALGNVRPGNESKIIFNDSIPSKTKYSVVYL
jgi:hypothetical protein